MTMPGRPSARALEFGRLYADSLARWSDLFNAAAKAVEAHVALGEAYSAAAGEFESWMKQAAAGPLGWMSPEALRTWTQAFSGGPAGQAGDRP
jgi:hypothetical protein